MLSAERNPEQCEAQTIREQLVGKFRHKMNRFGLVIDPTPAEAEELSANYEASLEYLLAILNPPSWAPILSTRTRVKELYGSYTRGEMRLGVYPQEINYPTVMYFQTGDCMANGADEFQVSGDAVRDGFFRALTGTSKLYYPSDIDLSLQRQFLWKKRNPVGEKRMELDVYNASKGVYEEHGVFINLFPDQS